MKNIIKIIVFLGLVFIDSIMPAASVEISKKHSIKTESALKKTIPPKSLIDELFQERIENMIIFNSEEERGWEHNLSLFSTKTENKGSAFEAFTLSLMNALDGSQTVFCSKFLFKNYIYLSAVWPDLLHLDPKSFRDKYKKSVDNLSDLELESIMKAVHEIDSIYSDNRSAASDSDKNIKILKLISSLSIDSFFLYYSFLLYKGYQNFKKENKYNIYEINEHFLLFFPKEKLNDALLIFNKNKNKYKDEFFMFRNFNQFSEIYFGLHIPLGNTFTYSEDNFLVNNGTWDYFIGESLIDGLQKLFINNFSWKKRRQEEHLPNFLLPRFNIVLGGHGYFKEYLMELNPNQLHVVLSFFNGHVWTKTLMLESCYIGGVNFKNIFGHSYEILNQFTENLAYTILFEGTLYLPTYYFDIDIDWINNDKNFQQYFYSTIFDYLSLGKAEYLKIIEKLNSMLSRESRIYNYVSIKFPNTGWIVANDYKKDVFNITKVKVAANSPQQKINIPEAKKIILMSTNVMPIEIVLDANIDGNDAKSFCKFLPVYYINPNYYISMLSIRNIQNFNFNNREIKLGRILSELFNVDINIQEPINIIIDHVIIGQFQIDNVLIDMYHKKIYFNMPNPLGGKSICYEAELGRITLNDFNLKKRIDDLRGKTINFSGVDNNFIKELSTRVEGKIAANKLPKLNPYAKLFSKLNPQATPFIPKLQPIQA